jgi:hypothetical protein
MKTAVELFAQRLIQRGIGYNINDFEEAKEMEKQQIIDARVNAPLLNTESKYDYVIEAEQYYNQTFKQQEQ